MSNQPNPWLQGGFTIDADAGGIEARMPAPPPTPPPDPFGEHIAAAGAEPASVEPASRPGMWGMAASFGASMARYAAGGFRKVAPEIHAERVSVCAGCEQHDGTRCYACGCYTNLKAWMPHEDCPLGRWPRHDSESS